MSDMNQQPPPPPLPQGAGGEQIHRLHNCIMAMRSTKDEIQELNTQIKAKKANLDEAEKFCIGCMMEMDKSWIDGSMMGHGPYICLDPVTSEPALKDNELIELFRVMISGVMSGQIKDPEQCLQYYKHIKSQNQSRKIKISTKIKRPTTGTSTEAIRLWEKGLDKPPNNLNGMNNNTYTMNL